MNCHGEVKCWRKTGRHEPLAGQSLQSASVVLMAVSREIYTVGRTLEDNYLYNSRLLYSTLGLAAGL